MVSEPAAATPLRTRFSERNVDLPIEVGEENAACTTMRAACASSGFGIKLYNEQKVKEGRDAADLTSACAKQSTARAKCTTSAFNRRRREIRLFSL